MFLLGMAAALASTVMAACSSVSSPSSNQKETFSGTLLPGGETFHAFSVPDKTGEFEITITNMNPVAVIGIALGQFLTSSGTNTCIATGYANAFSTVGKAVGGQIQKGAYCALVYDSNKSLTTATSYTITVTHP